MELTPRWVCPHSAPTQECERSKIVRDGFIQPGAFSLVTVFQPVIDVIKPKLAPLNEGGTAELLNKVTLPSLEKRQPLFCLLLSARLRSGETGEEEVGSGCGPRGGASAV